MESPVKMYITGVHSAPPVALVELLRALSLAYPGTYLGGSLYRLGATLTPASVVALRVGDGDATIKREWYLLNGMNSWNQEYAMTWQEAYNRYCSYNDN